MKNTYGFTAVKDGENPIIRSFSTLKARNEWIEKNPEHRRLCNRREKGRRRREIGTARAQASVTYGKDALPISGGGAKRMSHKGFSMM